MNEMLAIAMKLLSSRNCSERDVRRHLEKEFAALPEVDTHIEAVNLTQLLFLMKTK